MLIVATPQQAEAQAVAFSGAIPAPGAAGLLVTSVPLASSDLVSELEFSGCTPEMVGLLTQGKWQIYIPGAPATVNAGFPTSLTAATPFFTRCAVDSAPAVARPTDAESDFVQMLLDSVFTQPTLEGLRPYMHEELLASPGLDVTLEYTSVLTGRLVGEYYLYDYQRDVYNFDTGEVVTLSTFVVVGDFEKGKAVVSLVIVPSGATYRLVALQSVLATAADGQPGPGEVDFWTAPVGQCFSDESQVVDCATPHDNEIFAIISHPAGVGEPFPGDDALVDFGLEGCVPAFEGYVGAAYEASIYEIGIVRPTQAAWDEGGRRVICTLYQRDLERITGSARSTVR